MDQLEGRNPVIECLQRGRRRVHRVLLDRGAKPDRRVMRIHELAEAAGVRIEVVDRRELDKKAEGRVHNGVIALADPLPSWTAKNLMADVLERGHEPFVIVADEIQYEHNLGAILRSALGFGAHGVVVPTRRGAALSPVVQRVSMGAAEVVPVVREGLHSAIKHIRGAGCGVVGADMGGKSIDEIDLTGPLCFVMGGEGRGLSKSLRSKCDEVAAIPLLGGLESLNVSVAAAILMYEKQRQERALRS